MPYQNLACLYREQTRYQIQKGEPFDLSKGLQALAMAEQRKPEDSDSANTELQLRVLSAHALWSQQRDPSQELRAAESVAEKLRSIYPHDVGTYQSRGELLLAYLALSRDLPAESGLRTELAALDEGITRYPDVAGLRFLKAKLLLVLSTRLKTQPEQRQITESLALLEGLRPMLLHRAEYHMVRAEAKRLQATSRSGAMRAQTLLAAQQAEQEAKQINPLEPPFVGTRASIQSPFAHP